MENAIYEVRNPKTNQIEDTRKRVKECFDTFSQKLVYTQPSVVSEECINPFLNGLE